MFFLTRKRHFDLDSAAIRNGLRRLGLPQGGLVALHSSLSSLGRVEGGEQAVLSGFLDALGPQGTLMAPTFTHCFASGPSRLLSSQGAFDADSTPTVLGRVSEALRRLPGAVRSRHPIHSAAAVGPLAHDLTQGHEGSSDFGAQSPFGRLLAMNGAIALLGVGQHANSSIHAVEDMLDMPYLRDAEALVASPGGDAPARFPCRKCPVGDRDFYNRKASKWDDAIMATGTVRHGRVGRAAVQVMEAKPWAEAAVRMLSKQPDLLLCDRPRCRFCVWAKRRIRIVGIKPAVA